MVNNNWVLFKTILHKSCIVKTKYSRTGDKKPNFPVIYLEREFRRRKMKNNYKFIAEAEKIYMEDSRRFGFAFWKYRELLKTANVFEKVVDGCTHMYAVNKNKLIFYWSDNNRMIIPKEQLIDFDIIYIPAKYKKSITVLENTHDIHEGFLQIYNNNFTETKSNENYYVDSFDFNGVDDFKRAADVLNDDSPVHKGNMSVDRLKSFTKLLVYDGNLWVFVKEKATNEPVSISISVYDKKLRQTDVEWVGVRYKHQGKRVGRMLMAETVRRAKTKSDIIQVGGIVDDFYRKCGFEIKTEPQLWIKKKGSNASWWD